ncbi:MAG: sigma-70 family RNA polymerase sigma factor [Opitutales bacterium]|nr:sigma-70 family RNA polymerase sigma factor [Opitutales bacterium]
MVASTLAIPSTTASKHCEKRPDWTLVRNHLPLLKNIIGKMSVNFPPTLDRESIYTVGLLGLISASQTFNQRKDAAFGTYAAIRIRGALLDELRRMDWLPRHLRTQVKAVKKKILDYEQTHQQPLSDEEICKLCQLNEKKWQRLKPYLKPCTFLPLQTPVSFGEESSSKTMEDCLEDIKQKTGRELCERKELLELLKLQLQFLNESEKQVLHLHYQEGLFLSEIARRVQSSQSHIWQVHAAAIEKIRRRVTRALRE